MWILVVATFMVHNVTPSYSGDFQSEYTNARPVYTIDAGLDARASTTSWDDFEGCHQRVLEIQPDATRKHQVVFCARK